MPTAKQFQDSNLITLLLFGQAGGGKSTLAMQAPNPIAALLVDKPIVASLPSTIPGYDANQIFWKSYPPPETDLTNSKSGRPRNVADAILQDLMSIKNALVRRDKSIKMGDEEWPLPRTLIIEGGDFISHHVEDWVCAVNNMKDPSEWEDRFTPWRLRLNKLNQIYDLLTYLPSAHLCNVVVTTGVDHEQKMQRNEKGKLELQPTGFTDPDLGGKMNIQGPRKFANSFYCIAEAGKWWGVTKPSGKYVKYRGIRSGQFGLDDIIDITIDVKRPVNQWQRLFGSSL